jgi:hypothetical protein
MSDDEIVSRNAIIERAENDLLSEKACFDLTLDYGTAVQLTGRYPVSGEVISSLMRLARVNKWSDMSGSCVRVKASSTGVYAVGHLLLDQWVELAGNLKEADGKPPTDDEIPF